MTVGSQSQKPNLPITRLSCVIPKKHISLTCYLDHWLYSENYKQKKCIVCKKVLYVKINQTMQVYKIFSMFFLGKQPINLVSHASSSSHQLFVPNVI